MAQNDSLLNILYFIIEACLNASNRPRARQPVL